ncbi:MAG: geranylgeranyl reductase family protein [Phaeodactylibacter sp.]|nr:geranylgeranyl reductase family protein [Phaeodactylibacter sp.]
MKASAICIVGAGPGGTATALKLSYLGIPCTLIDKADFPRDKVCGDAISGKVTTLLSRLDPDILERFDQEKDIQSDVWGIRFVAPNRKALNIPFRGEIKMDHEKAPGYVSKRIDFDHFLIREVQRRSNIELHLNTEISHYERCPLGYRIQSKDGQFERECKLLILANGAHSQFSRHHAGLEKDNKHHAAALRAYYKGLKGLGDRKWIELHFVKELAPGYLWIFPLPDDHANVGLGMRSDILQKKGVHLRETFDRLLATHPDYKERFADATLLGKVQGFPLPLGSKKRPISGDHFLLIGDAGHLIDPLTGEGIGNAFYSGFIAAELAEKCLAADDFSAEFLKAYDVRVARVLGSEMRLSYRLQQALRYPVLANIIAAMVHSNQRILQALYDMYTDLRVRRQLLNPLFWLRLLFGWGRKKKSEGPS